MQNWEYKKLCDVCKTGSGGTPLKGHKEYYDNGNIPWLRSGEVCQKDITKSELYITEVGMNNSSAKLFPINTVLVAMYGATAGQVGILRFESTTNQAVCGIFPNEKTIPEFIYYYFTFYKDKLVAQAVGGAQPNISQIKIANTIIPLPPLEEQKRIVKILDEKFAMLETVKANAKANLQNAKDLFQSQLTNAFSNTTWEKKRLGEVCSYFKKQGKYDHLPYIGMEDIESKTGLFLGTREVKTVQSSTFYFEKNEILFGRLRPYLAKVYQAEFIGHCSTEIFPIRTNNELIPSFLKLWLLSDQTIDKINGTCTGARMPRADMNEVLTFEIPLPPLSEQKRIVEQLDSLSQKVRSLEEIYTKQLANFDELKQAFLAKAFAGEL